MSLDFSGLGDLAQRSAKAAKPGWEPLTQADLGAGQVLFFDQSLTATGWVKVVSWPGHTQVTEAGKIKVPTGDNSVETMLRRGVEIFEQTVVLIDGAIGMGYSVAHESPPNPAQVKGGGYGSLMSAQSVRNAAALMQVEIVMLGAQPAKKIICGSAKADKIEAHAALKQHCFPWIEGSEKVTNEATRDALMGALLWLYRQPKTGR